ncbi:MAG: hypothetical protein P1P80_07460 [ANME-2 cluster archaeon]|nr:hypothetical protein [ANME-2 cluster archaeon]
MEESETDKKKGQIDNIRIFKTGLIIILLLIMLVASFGFYQGMHSAIYDLFENRFTNLIGSFFDLVIIIAILYIVREFYIKKP